MRARFCGSGADNKTRHLQEAYKPPATTTITLSFNESALHSGGTAKKITGERSPGNAVREHGGDSTAESVRAATEWVKARSENKIARRRRRRRRRSNGKICSGRRLIFEIKRRRWRGRIEQSSGGKRERERSDHAHTRACARARFRAGV